MREKVLSLLLTKKASLLHSVVYTYSQFSMMMVMILLLVIANLGQVPSDVSGQPTSNNRLNFSTYKDSIFPLKIQYPSDWNRIQGYRGNIVSFFSPLRNSSDMSSEVVSLAVETLPSKNMTLEEYTAKGLDYLMNSNLTGFKGIESNATTLGGYPAHKLVYVFSRGGIEIQLMQVYTLKDDRVYIVSYRAAKEQYSDSLATAEKMIASLQIGTVEIKFP